MNLHDQMRQTVDRLLGEIACLEWAIAAQDPWPELEVRVRDMKKIAQQALSHVNETPKNEHDSDDMLNKTGNMDIMREALRQNVRAFRNKNDGEVKYILHSGNNEADWEDVMIIPNLPNEVVDSALAEPAPTGEADG